MSVKMKFGSKDIPFVYKGDKLVYPNPIKDGLLLWYDFKGMRNTDTNKEVAKDLSGNGNDGTLTNFNFTEESGYKDNTLVFDGVDDSLTIPELELDETAMSVMHDGKLYAYEDDKVLTVGEDGEIIGEKVNLLSSTSLSHTMKKTLNMAWGSRYGDFIAEPLKTYTVKVYVKPTTSSVSAQIVFRGSDGLNLKESGVGNWIIPGEEGYVTRTYQAPEGTASAWIQIRNNERLDSGTMLEYKELQVFERSHSKFYSSNPSDYKSTALNTASLTDLQLYNKTLRKEELLHNAESKGLKKLKDGVPVQDGLVLHYDFSNESNTSEYKGKAFDYSGNGNHGVLNNFNYTEESGYAGDALKFDGVDDYILSNSLDKDYFDTIKNFNFDFVLNQKDIASKGTVILMPLTGQRLTVKSSEDSIAVGRYTSHWFGRKTPPLKRGINHFSINVILLGEGEYELNEPSFLIEMYVNGTLVEDVYASSSDYYSNVASVLTIGWQGTDVSQGENAYLNESLHSLKIYNRSLTPEEIAHNYAIEKEKFNITEGEM